MSHPTGLQHLQLSRDATHKQHRSVPQGRRLQDRLMHARCLLCRVLGINISVEGSKKAKLGRAKTQPPNKVPQRVLG